MIKHLNVSTIDGLSEPLLGYLLPETRAGANLVMRDCSYKYTSSWTVLQTSVDSC